MARIALGAASLATFLSVAGATPYAHPQDPGPICRAPSVIDVMSRELRQRDHYSRVEPQLIWEYPGATSNVVLCGVSVGTLRYDAFHSGDVPLHFEVSHQFRVRAVLDGYVVKFIQ